MIKNLKLEMKRHKTVKPIYVCYQPHLQPKAANKYRSHLPVRTDSIKNLSNQRTQLRNSLQIKNLYVVSFLSLRSTFILCNFLLCHLHLEEFKTNGCTL
jgi:hypothetical protein